MQKILSIFTKKIGEINLIVLLIIVATITVNFKLLERNLPKQIGGSSSKSKRVGPVSLKGNYVTDIVITSPDAAKGGTLPANLIDGSLGTAAAPGNSSFEYAVDLGGTYEVNEVTLTWGSYGRDPNYIQSWTLEGKEDTSSNTPWKKLASGDKSPASDNSVVKLEKIELAQLKIKASGPNYIGIYELGINGKLVD